MPRVVVAKVDEIPPGGRKLVVPFRGKAGVGVFNVDGSFYALRNLCPHKLGPLCTGNLGGVMAADAPVTAEDHGLHMDRSGEILRCPWHLWPFDIKTGQCLRAPEVSVRMYPVMVEGNEIVIDYEGNQTQTRHKK